MTATGDDLPDWLRTSPPLGERDEVVEWLKARRDYREGTLGWSYDDAQLRYSEEYARTRSVAGTRRVRDTGDGTFEFVVPDRAAVRVVRRRPGSARPPRQPGVGWNSPPPGVNSVDDARAWIAARDREARKARES